MVSSRVIEDESNLDFPQNVSHKAIRTGDYETAWTTLNQVLHWIEGYPAVSQRDALLVGTCLELAKVSFVVGKGFDRLIQSVQNAVMAAERLGDRRSAAMLNLHLGRLYYFGEERHLAMDVFARGKAAVDALGDEDIVANAAELIGLYLFIQGRYPEAMPYFEEAAKDFEFGEQGHSGAMWLSYCAAFIGQHHQAIGTLDFYRRLAIERGDPTLATTLRAALGIFLVRIKQSKEAAYHLSGALQRGKQTQNILASYFAMGGLSFHHLMEGRLEESRQWMIKAYAEGAKAGLIRQYASPFVIETLYEFHRNGLEPIPGFTFQEECDRLLDDPNIHLKGVALRLRALDAMAESGVALDEIESDLKKSEMLLMKSGDPVQLGKTRIAMTRLKLSRNNPGDARQLAQKAWKNFSGYADVFYPDDLRRLLVDTVSHAPAHAAQEELVDMFSAMIQDLVPSDDLDDLLGRVVLATNRFFGAERGGIFWFQDSRSKKAPVLRAACNLFQSDIKAEPFRSNLTVIFDAYRQNRPLVVRRPGGSLFADRIHAMLAVPFQIQGQVRGVLYHDNAYVNDCFDRFSTHQLARMAGSLSRYVGHLLQFTQRLEQRTAKRLSRIGQLDQREIVGSSPALANVLEQADRIAETNSTVLILGETGVGKELLARRIHNHSLRKHHPLVVVDPTSIPETLFESELFGHEKGAFTGADGQKAGRIELAHNGTLFIDEVGEIPLSIQVKLLRTVQEKTMVRVGGTKTISSDFRLIAATNRDLAREVKAGRFREDLFYRLNVIPMTLPPLRDRRDDILLLAEHFIQRFSVKHNRSQPGLCSKATAALKSYDWPGNIRELENTIERSVLLCANDEFELSLPAGINRLAEDKLFEDLPSLEEMQRRYISFVLDKTKGKIAGENGAAALLGMKRTTLYKRMKKLGLR